MRPAGWRAGLLLVGGLVSKRRAVEMWCLYGMLAYVLMVVLVCRFLSYSSDGNEDW